MSTKIYVMTHKKTIIPSDSAYVPLHVGRELTQDLGYLGDNTGDNISEFNPLFGELTGIYWIWKNSDFQGNIGICHYRRYFLSPENSGCICSGDEYDEILSEYDLITSENISGMQHEKSVRDIYYEAHNPRDLNAVEHAIKKIYPEYYDTCESVLDGYDLYFGNLCVMPRYMFDSYCEWMFNILFEAGNEVDVTGYDKYHARVYGFMSEALLIIWVKHHNYKAYESKVVITDEKAENKELKTAIQQLLNQNKPEEAMTLLRGVLEERPDIALPSADLAREIPIIQDILVIITTERRYHRVGMLDYSNQLNVLVEHYKKLHEIFALFSNGVIRQEDIEYIHDTQFSDVAFEGILQTNIHEILGLESLNEEYIRTTIKPLLIRK